MPVPYTFGSATSSIPLSQLDSNFATPVTIGSSTVALGNTITTITGLTTLNTLTVGLGSGSVATNTVVGAGALATNTTGSNNTAIGGSALSVSTTVGRNTAIGYVAGLATTTGHITAVGAYALYSNTTGDSNVAVGGNNESASAALQTNTTGSNNTAVGVSALQASTTGGNNTAIGKDALYANTTASNNTVVGYQAGYGNTTGDRNTYIGDSVATGATGGDNTGIGRSSLSTLTSGNGNVGLGDIGAGGQIFNLTSESNRLIAGHNSISNAYVKVAWTVTSDARDKTDVTPSTYGLSFVTALKPVTFKWDERENYKNSVSDGSKKKSKTQLGFLAQDVIALEESLGTSSNDLLIADNEQDYKLKITETKMIPVLVKAIQELKAEFDAYKATHP